MGAGRDGFGFTDMHCHVLPAVDDGSRDMTETIAMLHIAEQEGIRRMIVTPHYKEGRHSPNADKILERMNLVQKVADEEGIHIQLYPGNEIYYTSELEEKLDTGRAITLCDSDYLLVEFSPFEDFVYIRNAMDNILSLGYIPVLAHVERYQCMLTDTSHVEVLRSMGCRIQVNASSVTGGNGRKVKKFVHKILKLEYVDYIGTDAHNIEGRKPEMRKCAEVLCKKYGENVCAALMNDNAVQTLLSQDLLYE